MNKLTPAEIQLLDWLRRELSDELGPEEFVEDCDLVRFALRELQQKFRNSEPEDVLLRLSFYLWNTRQNSTDR